MAQLAKFLSSTAGVASGGGANLDIDNVFSCHLYEGNGSTQVIENGIALGNSNDGGSVKFGNSGDQYGNKALVVADNTDFQFGTGNWTIEAFVYPIKDDNFVVCSWGESSGIRWDFGWQSSSNPRIMVNTSSSSQTSTASSTPISGYLGQWVHMACVRNGSDITLYVGGVAKTTMSYTGSSFPNPSTGGVNIGARFFTGQSNVENSSFGYITDFRIVKGTAVYTSNFTPSTSALTAISGTSFLALSGDTPLVDQSGNSHSISQNSLNSGNAVASVFGRFTGSDGEGGLVWIKQRNTTRDHYLFDTARGATKYIRSNETNAESTENTTLTAFNPNGFSLGNRALINQNTGDYVSWTFRNSPMFQCLTYTGNSTAGRTVSHNLGSVPGLILIKGTSNSGDWVVYHRGLSNPTGNMLQLNSTTSEIQGRWNNTAPTSTQFTLNDSLGVNGTGRTFVAYLFAHHANDGSQTGFGSNGDSPVISCGSYTGNGSATGPIIDCGFEPQWLLLKDASSTGNWRILDSMRHLGIGNRDGLWANESSAEDSSNETHVNVTPTGFQVTTTNGQINANNETYIYMAIAHPICASSVPTDATKVFAISTNGQAGDSKAPAYRSTFPVDMYFEKSTGGSPGYISNRLTGRKYMQTNGTNAEATDSALHYDFMNGVYNSTGSISNYHGYMWKRAFSYFDCVGFLGTGSARTVSHNLGVVPEMFWCKSRDSTESWAVFHKNIGNGFQTVLNQANVPLSDSTSYNNTDPTSSVFTVGTNDQLNKSGDNYIAYLFATVDGISKVGSCSHTFGGGDTNVDCGFSNGCRFLLIKSTTHAYPWEVYDSVRGIVSGNDPYLKLNNTDAEVTNNDGIDPLSSGFTLTSTGWNTGTYIFYAIA